MVKVANSADSIVPHSLIESTMFDNSIWCIDPASKTVISRSALDAAINGLAGLDPLIEMTLYLSMSPKSAEMCGAREPFIVIVVWVFSMLEKEETLGFEGTRA